MNDKPDLPEFPPFFKTEELCPLLLLMITLLENLEREATMNRVA